MSNATFSYSGTVTNDDDGTVIDTQAFAGNDSRPGVNSEHIHGRNNSAYESVHKIGPLPEGRYKFGSWATTHEQIAEFGYPTHLGLMIASLTQVEGATYGRDGFFCHGESATDPLNSSEGCLCMNHTPREALMSLKPEFLTVTT
jgi:hypothetical protein